jgi:hypothetical protein
MLQWAHALTHYPLLDSTTYAVLEHFVNLLRSMPKELPRGNTVN